MRRGKFYNVNHYIRAKEVRVIDSNDKQIGVMPTTQALQKAKEKGLDLVEIVPQAKPPVCKIINFRRFIYEEKKKRHGNIRKKRRGDFKQVKLGLFIDKHDLERRVKKAKTFLKDGHKVKLIVFFKGRQITKKEFGFELLKNSQAELEAVGKISQPVTLKGKILSLILIPKSNAKTKNKKSS